MVALFCDDQLFIKPTLAGRAYIGEVAERAPYKGAKACFLIAGEKVEESDWLSELIRLTTAELPAPSKNGRVSSS